MSRRRVAEELATLQHADQDWVSTAGTRGEGAGGGGKSPDSMALALSAFDATDDMCATAPPHFATRGSRNMNAAPMPTNISRRGALPRYERMTSDVPSTNPSGYSRLKRWI